MLCSVLSLLLLVYWLMLYAYLVLFAYLVLDARRLLLAQAHAARLMCLHRLRLYALPLIVYAVCLVSAA